MSLPFSDTSTLRGIVQQYEQEIGAEQGYISENPKRLKLFVAAANSAFDDFLPIAFESEGTFQFDDSNHEDYPIILADLEQGVRDYPFLTDGSGNLILEFFKVLVADPQGVFHTLIPKDVQSETEGITGFLDGRNAQGRPQRYDKTANGIFLDLIPNYSYANGIKAYINREASYFTVSDTTKKPGVPGHLHRWFVIRPAEDHARRNNLANYAAIRAERIALEETIRRHFARRTHDERPRMTARVEDTQ